MSLGNIGRVLAGQAIESTKKNVMDALNPSEAPKPAAERPAPGAENIGAIVLGELQAAQRPLSAEMEVMVLFHTRTETIRVLQIFVPAPNVFVLVGRDDDQNAVRVVTPAASAQLVFKTVKVAEGSTPIRVSVLSPRPHA